jgi:hypothetical protein
MTPPVRCCVTAILWLHGRLPRQRTPGFNPATADSPAGVTYRMVWYASDMNVSFLSAAAASLLTCVVHVWLGGRDIARPLLDSPLPIVPKWTMYYCWHIVSFVLAAMAAGFAIAALDPARRDLALAATVAASGCLGLNLSLIAWRGPWRFPQWALFLPIALLGARGLWWR